MGQPVEQHGLHCGRGILIQFETDTCADPTGCFSLNSALILDSANIPDPCAIGNAIVTVGGGGTHHCQSTVPVKATSWGSIKSTFKN